MYYAVMNPCIKTSITTYSVIARNGVLVYPGIYRVSETPPPQPSLFRREDYLLLRTDSAPETTLMVASFRGRRIREPPPACTPLPGNAVALPRNTKKYVVMLAPIGADAEVMKWLRSRYRWAEFETHAVAPVRPSDRRLLEALGVLV